jgi:hypothetical protein
VRHGKWHDDQLGWPNTSGWYSKLLVLSLTADNLKRALKRRVHCKARARARKQRLGDAGVSTVLKSVMQVYRSRGMTKRRQSSYTERSSANQVQHQIHGELGYTTTRGTPMTGSHSYVCKLGNCSDIDVQ